MLIIMILHSVFGFENFFANVTLRFFHFCFETMPLLITFVDQVPLVLLVMDHKDFLRY